MKGTIVVLGLYPPMFRVWTVPRDEPLALVLAHTHAWTLINVGFVTATTSTAAGLAVLAATWGAGDGQRAVLIAAAIVYSIAGTLWCVVVAGRIRLQPIASAATATHALPMCVRQFAH